MFRHFQSQEHLTCKHSTCRNSPTLSSLSHLLSAKRPWMNTATQWSEARDASNPKCAVSSPPQSFGALLTSLSLFSLLSTIHTSMKSTSHSLFHVQNFSNILTFFFFLKPAQLSHNRKNLWKCVPPKKTMISTCNNNAVLSSEKESDISFIFFSKIQSIVQDQLQQFFINSSYRYFFPEGNKNVKSLVRL